MVARLPGENSHRTRQSRPSRVQPTTSISAPSDSMCRLLHLARQARTRVVPPRSEHLPPEPSIAAISRKPNSIDLFAVGADGGVYTAWWNEGWQDWSQLGEARFAEHTPITALAREANRPRWRGLSHLVGRFVA